MSTVRTCFRTALFLATALFTAGPALAQPSFNINGSGTSATISLLTNQAQTVTVSSSDVAITFHIGVISYDAGSNWLAVSQDSSTTTAHLTVQVTGAPPLGQHTATVPLVADSPSGVSNGTLTVNIGTGTGGGGGNLSTSTSSVVLSSVSGGSTQTTFTLSSTSSSGVFFTAAVQSSTCGTCISISPTSGTVSSSSSQTMTVQANAFGLPNNVYTATVVISGGGQSLNVGVQFFAGTTGGGGGNLTASPSTLNFSYVTGGNFPSPQPVGLSSTTGAQTYSATATSVNNWLLVNGSTQVFSATISSGLNVSLSNAVFSLATGFYTGTINVTASDSSTTSITVNLTINGGTSGNFTFSPSSVTLSSPAGSGCCVQQTVNVTSTLTGGFSASVSGTGLSVSQNSSTITPGQTVTVTVSGNPTGLGSTTYTGTLTVTVNSVSQSIPVSFTVGSGGGGVGTVAPTSLSFAFQQGVPTTPTQLNQTVTIGGTGSFTTSTSTQTGTNWLSVSPSSGTAPAFPAVAVNPQSLAAGTYTGSVTVTSSSGTTVISVTMLITANAVLVVNPPTLNFTYVSGNPAQTVSLNISGSDNSAQTVSVTTSSASWLSVTPSGGPNTPTVYGVQISPSGLANGVYSATITISGGTFANTPLTVPVVVTVTGSTSSTGLTVSPSSLTFNGAVNGNPPDRQTLAVSANTPTSFTASATTSWLTISPSGTLTTNTTITISANQTGLAAGTYMGNIQLVANGSTQTVPVTFVVGGGGGGGSGNVTVSPTSLSFSYTVGGSAPGGQALSITNTTSGTPPINFTITVNTQTGSGNWLSTGATSGTTPATLMITVNPAGLNPGTYNANLVITPNGGSAVTVPVTFTVIATPTVSVSPTLLTFTYRVGDAAPASQQLAVSSPGASLAFSVTATSSGWLKVSPTSGSTPATLTVSVDPTSLTAGTYNGTITVGGTGSPTGSTTVNVTLTVTQPLPTITKLTSAASFIAATAGGAISPGEIISLFGTALGPATPVGLTLDSTTGKVSTSIGGVQVLFNGIPGPMVYASSTQVNAVVPYEVAGLIGVNVLIRFSDQTSNAIPVPVAATVPGIFTANSSGTGPGAILNQDNTTNGPGNAAPKGTVVSVYLTGEGQTNPLGVTGKVTTVSATPPLTPVPLLPIAVLIDNQPANYTFAGEAPGLVSGVLQLNVQIPANARSGDLSLVVSIGNNSSQTGVTVSVR